MEFEAIKIKPQYPDAYFGIAETFFAMKKYEESKTFVFDGLSKKPPIYNMIVWNPRDYDYNPMMLLFKIYFQQGKPKEAKDAVLSAQTIYPNSKYLKDLIKILDNAIILNTKIDAVVDNLKKAKDKNEIKNILDNISDDIKYHPKINVIRNTHFIKEQSSGKDIAIFCSFTEEEWDPATAKEKGIGGSEEAVINLSKEWAKAGYKITVFNNCGTKEKLFDVKSDSAVNSPSVDNFFVTYRPYAAFNPKDKYDIVIIWRHPMAADYKINAGKLFLDMHDVVPVEDFTPARIKKLDKIFFKSKAQRKLYPMVPENKAVIIPNGIDTSLFDKEVEKNPYYFLNTSSPDRGLETSIDLFKEILNKVSPEIRKKMKFGWFYGWGGWDSVFTTDDKAQSWKTKVMKKFNELVLAGYAEGGFRLSHGQIAEKYLEAGVFFYPSEFFEIDCVSVKKAQLAGAIPVTTDFGALAETTRYGIIVHSPVKTDNWIRDTSKEDYGVKTEKQKNEVIDGTVKMLSKIGSRFSLWENEREKMKDWARREHSKEKVAQEWLKNF